MLPAADQAALEKLDAANKEADWEDVDEESKEKVAKTVEMD